MRTFLRGNFLVALVLGLHAWTVQAQGWTRELLEPRAVDAVASRTVAAVHAPSAKPVRQVVVSLRVSAEPSLKTADAPLNMSQANSPWIAAAMGLAERGIAVIYLDAPSDAGGRALHQRSPSEIRSELQAAVKLARRRFPEAIVVLGGFALSGSVIQIAVGMDDISRAILVGSTLMDDRTRNLGTVRTPVLMVHAPSAQCDAAPFIEAMQFARRHQLPLVQAGYAQTDPSPGCGTRSQHALLGLEAAFAKLVADWLDGQTVPEAIGSQPATLAWREEVVSVDAPGALGSTVRLEMTLLLPNGPGPHPVLLFNHGDIGIDHPAQRYKRRLRNMRVNREFLNLGIAVAELARRGVGLSEGNYPSQFAAGGDGDPTYKARVHAADITPALAYLRGRADIDRKKMMLAGQSAGGYSTMYLASTNPEGVIGAIDFSGGRTDMNAFGAGFLNRTMVQGFAEFGRSTRIPTLWIFAENDSRYSANTIRASHEAFVAAGGKAQLFLNTAIAGDGHFIYQRPELWRGALRSYLEEIGVVQRSPTQKDQPAASSPVR